MESDDPKFQDDALGFWLVTASRLLRLRFERALEAANLDITTGEARALAMVRRLGPVRQADLASYLNIEPMTMVGYLDRLEADGLIERVVHPSDRRSKLVRLTSKAKPLLRRIRKVLDDARSEATCHFDAAELHALQGYLQRLCHDLGGTVPKRNAVDTDE